MDLVEGADRLPTTNPENTMPATKKILPRAITLTVDTVGTRATASGKHSAYPKRLAAPAALTLDGATVEVKRVSGTWLGDRLEFIYWLQDGVARWTDLTPSEAAAIDAGKSITIASVVTAPAEPAPVEPTPAPAPAEPTPEPTPAEPAPEPVATKRRRRATAEA